MRLFVGINQLQWLGFWVSIEIILKDEGFLEIFPTPNHKGDLPLPLVGLKDS